MLLPLVFSGVCFGVVVLLAFVRLFVNVCLCVCLLFAFCLFVVIVFVSSCDC